MVAKIQPKALIQTNLKGEKNTFFLVLFIHFTIHLQFILQFVGSGGYHFVIFKKAVHKLTMVLPNPNLVAHLDMLACCIWTPE